MAESKGLPMAAKWDPEKIAKDNAYLQDLEKKPFFSRIRGYAKMTGPAWLQSAMTLGAGSAAASVIAGASFGYQLLWVQPVAMLLGVIMFAALGNFVLTSGERPYTAVRRELHPSAAFLWALATIVASVIWHFPQYGMASAVALDLAQAGKLVGGEGAGTYAVRIGAGVLILCINVLTVWNYGSGSKGIKIYETFLRWVIRIVILAFLFAVIWFFVARGMDGGKLLKGFFAFSVPEGSLTVVLGAIGASVGINMTFLYPYSLLAKGWGKHHKGLARWDLFSSMLVPFVIVTSLIIIASANSIYFDSGGVKPEKLSPVIAAGALQKFLGPIGRIIFDLGFFGMACGAISTHMVVCGFTWCEMLGLEYTTKRFRLFALTPSIGIIGVILPSPFWMPVVASAICLTMLPIAYIIFALMNNKRSYIGDAVGKGPRRWVFNGAIVAAIALAVIGAGININDKAIKPVMARIFPSAKPAAPQTPLADGPTTQPAVIPAGQEKIEGPTTQPADKKNDSPTIEPAK